MTVGILQVVLFIHGTNSLKEKRTVLLGLKSRLRKMFNIAVTQVADDDLWQKATLAIVSVERERKCMDSLFAALLNFLEHYGGVDVIDYGIELI
jgi:uncharacterized protein YlxP (DUF503 family)